MICLPFWILTGMYLVGVSSQERTPEGVPETLFEVLVHPAVQYRVDGTVGVRQEGKHVFQALHIPRPLIQSREQSIFD